MTFIKKNKIYILIFICCITIMLISCLYETNIFYVIKEYLFNSEYKNSYISNSDVPIDFELNLTNIIKFHLSNYKWTYDYMLIWGINIFQLLLPFLATISALIFYNKNKSINAMAINKQKSYKKFIFKESLNISLHIAISVFCAFIVFFIIALIVSKGATDNNITRSFLTDIIGMDNYHKYTGIYYFVDGFIKLFLIPLLYSIIACVISLFVKNAKQVLIVPIISYFLLYLISFGLTPFWNFAFYLNPLLIMVTGDYSNINSFLVLLIPLSTIFLSYLGITWKGNKIEI